MFADVTYLTDHVSIIRMGSDIFSRWYLENICGQKKPEESQE